MKGIILSGLLLCFAQLAYAQDVPIFTNESLQKYGHEAKIGKESSAQVQSVPDSAVHANRKSNDGSEKKYYCSKATELKERIKAAKDEEERQKIEPKVEPVMMENGAIIERYPGIE